MMIILTDVTGWHAAKCRMAPGDVGDVHAHAVESHQLAHGQIAAPATRRLRDVYSTVVSVVRCTSLLFLFVLITGCSHGPDTYQAGGTVSYSDGKPLTEGWVSFRSLDNEKNVTARGQIQPDGSFELATFRPNDGAVEGRHQAIVVPLAKGMRGLPGQVAATSSPTFDSRFSSYDKSSFEFVVTDDADANKFKIVVE